MQATGYTSSGSQGATPPGQTKCGVVKLKLVCLKILSKVTPKLDELKTLDSIAKEAGKCDNANDRPRSFCHLFLLNRIRILEENVKKQVGYEK